MNLSETVQLSIKAIIANRLRSSLTILGIVIGVTSVILLISLVTGVKSFITKQISSLGPNTIFVIPGKIGGGRGPGGIQTNRLTLQDATLLQTKLQGIAEVSAGIQSQAILKYQNKSSESVTVVGVQANYPKIIKNITITSGRLFTSSEEDSSRKVVVIGPTVVNHLFPSGNPLNKQIIIGTNKYSVIGVIGKRGSNLGLDLDNFAMIPLPSAQKQFGEDKVHNIVVAANEGQDVKELQPKIVSILKKRLSENDFTVQTQEQTLSTISQITGILTAGLGGIAAISLLVGGIGIMNIMLVSVTERTREIGLRKALGAKPKDIRNQFLVEALTLSGVGGIIGIILGFLFSLIANNFIQTEVPLWAVLLSFSFSAVVGVVFGVAPAIRASRLNPIQALRYE